jgi:hypothetical protein
MYSFGILGIRRRQGWRLVQFLALERLKKRDGASFVDTGQDRMLNRVEGLLVLGVDGRRWPSTTGRKPYILESLST